jgi:hypothetical protein
MSAVEPSQIEARLSQYKGTRDWSISGTWYTAECGAVSYSGSGKHLRRKLVVLLDGGNWWNVRAATHSALVAEAEWVVWPRGLDIDEANVEAILQMQFKTMAQFENRARMLNEDGIRLAGLVLTDIGPLLDQESLVWLTRQWVVESPWSEGCGWDWWRVAMRDLETRMKKSNLDMAKRFRIRALVYGMFERVISTMRGEG